MQFASDSDRDFTLWPTLLAWIARSGRPQTAEWRKEGVGLTTWMPLILECGSGFWRFLLIIKEWWPRELRREEFRAVNQSTAMWCPGFQKLMNSMQKVQQKTPVVFTFNPKFWRSFGGESLLCLVTSIWMRPWSSGGLKTRLDQPWGWLGLTFCSDTHLSWTMLFLSQAVKQVLITYGLISSILNFSRNL